MWDLPDAGIEPASLLNYSRPDSSPLSHREAPTSYFLVYRPRSTGLSSGLGTKGQFEGCRPNKEGSLARFEYYVLFHKLESNLTKAPSMLIRRSVFKIWKT